MTETDVITSAQLRAQIEKMWLRRYPDGPTNQEWILNVGIGAGMMWRAAEHIERLEAALRESRCPRPVNFAGEESVWWCIANGYCGCGHDALLGSPSKTEAKP